MYRNNRRNEFKFYFLNFHLNFSNAYSSKSTSPMLSYLFQLETSRRVAPCHLVAFNFYRFHVSVIRVYRRSFMKHHAYLYPYIFYVDTYYLYHHDFIMTDDSSAYTLYIYSANTERVIYEYITYAMYMIVCAARIFHLKR